MKKIKIAVAGLGTVGEAVIKILHHRQDLLRRRHGVNLEIVGITARDREKPRSFDVTAYRWFDSALAMLQETQPDIVVELIGGSDGIAYELVCEAIARRMHVVTANKALLAERGNELAAAAEAQAVTIAYEAAIGGGIPIVKAVREAAAASAIESLSGILNGTCNFILTRMMHSGSDFAEALAEAQRLGYAEADPSFDIGGTDAAHKLALLSALAFGCRVDLSSLSVEGITGLDKKDINFARELGYCIKLLAVAEKNGTHIRQSVAMRMLPLSHPLAHVEDSFNAVNYCDSENERVTLQGRGAGGGPTATAVIADIIDLAKGVRYPPFGAPYESLSVSGSETTESVAVAHYVRLHVCDVAGVLSRVSQSFFEHDISVESLIQHGRAPGMPVSVVFVTHSCTAEALARALAQVRQMDFMLAAPCVIEISE